MSRRLDFNASTTANHDLATAGHSFSLVHRDTTGNLIEFLHTDGNPGKTPMTGKSAFKHEYSRLAADSDDAVHWCNKIGRYLVAVAPNNARYREFCLFESGSCASY